MNKQFEELKKLLMKTANNQRNSDKIKQLSMEALDVLRQSQQIYNLFKTDKEKNSFAYDVFGFLSIPSDSKK